MNRKTKIITDLLLSFVLVTVLLVSLIPAATTAAVEVSLGSPYYNGDRAEKRVSLSFNVYENAEVVRGIADLLESYGIKATFFVGGCWADDNGETLNYLVGKGEEIANHGYFHRDHKKLDYDGNVNEIKNAEKVVFALCGVKTALFAPPSGSFSDVTIKAAQDLGYRTVMWSKDTIDWRDKDEDTIISRATKNLSNGDIVLMHPKSHTLSALPKIIESITENGFSIVTVGENLGN